jgi:hypothetical protein
MVQFKSWQKDSSHNNKNIYKQKYTNIWTVQTAQIQPLTTKTEKNDTHGLFDCPWNDCEIKIIGSYGDLLAHVKSTHPLVHVFGTDGETMLERIKEAQKDALEKDINEQMVVETEWPIE